MTIIDIPDKPNQFYQFAIHMIYAVVIAQGLTVASQILTPLPIESVLTLKENVIEEIFAITFAFFIVTSSWVSYSKSMSADKMQTSQYGIYRFIVDLIILFLYFILLNMANPENLEKYHHMFFIMPAIYIFYYIWDKLKFVELQNVDGVTQQTRMNRMSYTLYAMTLNIILTVVFVVIYQNITSYETPAFFVLYICLSFLIVAWYRTRKLKAGFTRYIPEDIIRKN